MHRPKTKRPPFLLRSLNWKKMWWFLIFCLIAWFISFISRASGASPDIVPLKFAIEQPMFVSGFISAILCLCWSVFLDRSPVTIIKRWHDSCVFSIDPRQMERIQERLISIEIRTTIACTVLIVLVTVAGYIHVYSMVAEIDDIIEVIDEFIENEFIENINEFIYASFYCSILAGARLGKLLTYGRLAGMLEAHEARINLMIEHPDHAGGTAQIGYFYLFQALVLIVPIGWLIAWLLAISLYPLPNYAYWTDLFLVFLFFCAMTFGAIFCYPMIAFRRLILSRKRSHVQLEIIRTRTELVKLIDAKSPTPTDHAQRHDYTKYLQALVSIPDWPVSRPATVAFIGIVGVPIAIVILEYIFSFVK